MLEQDSPVDVWDLINWFSERKLEFMPGHFVKASTPITQDSLLWIEGKLRGRYTLLHKNFSSNTRVSDFVPAFEDPKEATLYELTWS